RGSRRRRDLHSFPTRRSSDLAARLHGDVRLHGRRQVRLGTADSHSVLAAGAGRICAMRAWAVLAVCCAASLGAEAATFVRLQSQPGDPTLDGPQRLEYDDPGTGFYSFTVTPNAAGGVDFTRAPNCGSTVCAPGSDYTAVQFAPVGGQPFGVGTYPSAQRYSNTPAS